MENLENVKKYIKQCEQELKQLKNTRADKTNLLQMHAELKDSERILKAENDCKSKQELLKEVDSLLFIVSSMLDYYEEEKIEK